MIPTKNIEWKKIIYVTTVEWQSSVILFCSEQVWQQGGLISLTDRLNYSIQELSHTYNTNYDYLIWDRTKK